MIGMLAAMCVAAGLAPGGGVERSVTEFGAWPGDERPCTAAIQAALDACAGGGTVVIPAGRFVSGGLRLRSGVRIRLAAGATLRGSGDWRDYGRGAWTDALFTGEAVSGVRIEGPGRIDGGDCMNPAGEEGFRGPHAFRFERSTGIVFCDVMIENASNYAILCNRCSDIRLTGVTIHGGHDGLHAQGCARGRVERCDFRTGDDCVAGCDSREFRFSGCRFNSACNAFRFGCVGMVVRSCEICGPGEYPYRKARRFNMLSAFEHFAPLDRDPKLPSDRWLIEDVKIRNVDRVYNCDFERDLWQKGQPPRRIRFHRVWAEGVAQPLRAWADAARGLELALDEVSIRMAAGAPGRAVLDAARFGSLTLNRVTLESDGTAPALRAADGGAVRLTGVRVLPARADWAALERVGSVRRGR